jgi:hypothetical protein
MWQLTEDDVGSIFCPVCGMHVSKSRILAWRRLSDREKQARCPRYIDKIMCGEKFYCPELPSDENDRPIVLWEGHDLETYALVWHSLEGEGIVGEECLKLSQDTVRDWFALPKDESAIDCYEVTASQRRHLMKLVNTKIDLNEYYYFLEGRTGG